MENTNIAAVNYDDVAETVERLYIADFDFEIIIAKVHEEYAIVISHSDIMSMLSEKGHTGNMWVPM